MRDGEKWQRVRSWRGVSHAKEAKVQIELHGQNDCSDTTVKTGWEEGKTGQERLVRRPLELGEQ